MFWSTSNQIWRQASGASQAVAKRYVVTETPCSLACKAALCKCTWYEFIAPVLRRTLHPPALSCAGRGICEGRCWGSTPRFSSFSCARLRASFRRAQPRLCKRLRNLGKVPHKAPVIRRHLPLLPLDAVFAQDMPKNVCAATKKVTLLWLQTQFAQFGAAEFRQRADEEPSPFRITERRAVIGRFHLFTARREHKKCVCVCCVFVCSKCAQKSVCVGVARREHKKEKRCCGFRESRCALMS